MNQGQEIFVDDRNGRPQRTVAVYDRGIEIHRDYFNTDDTFRLQQFTKAARQRGTGKDDGWQELFDAIRREADTKDKTALESLDQPITYQRITCRELDSGDYRLEYLVNGMLVAGQPCVFAGGKKCLKTSLLIALGLSLATGEDFLGRFKVRRCARVLMMSGESGIATIQETARRIATAMGVTLADVGGLIFSPDLPIFGHHRHMDSLRSMLTENEIETLIVDPAYLTMPTDGREGSLFAVGALLRSVVEVCQECGVTFVLAHHTRKTLTDPFAPPELEDIAWAGFNEFARQWVLIGRRERYEPGSGEHRLWLNAGGSAGHSSCWALDVAEGAYDGQTPRRWDVSLLRAEEARQDAEQRQEGAKDQKRKATLAARLEFDRKAIVIAMRKMPEHTGTKTELKERSHLSTGRLSYALASLAEDGTILDCEVTKGNNRPYPAWKLRPDTDA